MSITPYRWPHLMRIVSLKHTNKNGEIIEETYNLSNMLHVAGENFILSCCFRTDVATVPLTYYLGLDNRTLIQSNDVMSSLIGEPSGYGYSRQPVSSASGFTVTNYLEGVDVKSPVVSFSAVSGSYGPVRNLFLTTRLDNAGVLIATAALAGPRTLRDGDVLTMQLAVSLQNDPDAGSPNFLDLPPA